MTQRALVAPAALAVLLATLFAAHPALGDEETDRPVARVTYVTSRSVYIDAGRENRVERLVDRDGECDQSKMNDVTETSLDASQFENVIVNDGSLEKLHENIDRMMEKLAEEVVHRPR